jgi:hypothetical protein
MLATDLPYSARASTYGIEIRHIFGTIGGDVTTLDIPEQCADIFQFLDGVLGNALAEKYDMLPRTAQLQRPA